MKKISELYFCHNCKKIISSIDQLLFVEQKNGRGFCHEDCIEAFYAPIIEVFRKLEEDYRQNHGLLEEACLASLEDEKAIEKLITAPEKTVVYKNKMGDEYHHISCSFEDDDGRVFWMFAIASYFDNKPSFVYLITSTYEPKLLEFLTIDGENKEEARVEDLVADGKEGFGTMVVDDNFVEQIEGKKSRILAEVLSIRSDDDIALEEFLDYGPFLQKTMEGPDEIYMEVDREGDKIYKYVKVCTHGNLSFIYFVFCTPYEKAFKQEGQANEMEALLPIISFPSKDPQFISHMKRGKQISGSLKN